MNFKTESITTMLKQQIADYQADINVDDIGTVITVGDGIAHISGLQKAMAKLKQSDFGVELQFVNFRS